MELVENAVGRLVPKEINGRKLKPFAGVEKTPPDAMKLSRRVEWIRKGEYKVKSLEDVIKRAGIEDGMTVSFHHCLREGDMVVNTVVEKLARMGLKDLRLAPTALFPVHQPLIEHIKNGVITRIEGSLNGPLGETASKGMLKEPVILRSHGGRTRAVECGDLKIDAAFLAASISDDYGNCNGTFGKSAFGAMGFAFVDAWYAEKVVIVTDNLVRYPATPITIPQTHVDYVTQVESIGDPEKIALGTLQITKSPTRLKIARYVVDMIKKSGLLKEGFSFQAGAGGISLAVVKFLREVMRKKGVKGSFAMGGITQFVVEMLEDGIIDTILDAQSFDLGAVKSLRKNPKHVEISHYFYANPHNKGNVTNRINASFLGATEVDVNFNVNVNTHSDGILLHGIGGHPDAAMADVTFITVPLFRRRIPVIVDEVTTVTTPGETVDVVVTERGIAINPRREDLIEALKGSNLPIKSIEDLRDDAERITGKPKKVEFTDEIVALVEYRDGTIIDVVRKVKED